MKITVLTTILAVFFSFVQQCGTITESDTGILGKVEYSDGADAANANVKIFGARDSSRTVVAEQNTDLHGNFDFHRLDPGSYNVWVESQDSLVALVDSIYVPEDSLVTANAVLDKGGSITAVVGLQPGHDPKSVTVQALGTQRYTNVNDSGWFTLKRLAHGEYTLRLISTIPGYTPTYASITIRSDVNDTLADTLFMVYAGIPPVTGIMAHYDSFSGIGKISWNKMRYSNFYEYRVYRDKIGELNPGSFPIAACVDTAYFDTLYREKIPDSIFADSSGIVQPDQNFRYRVTIVNKSMKEGEKYDFADIHAKDPCGLVPMISPIRNTRIKDSSGILVIWNGNAATNNYQIQLSESPDFQIPLFDSTLTDTLIVLPSLSLNYYYLRLRAQRADGTYSFWSLIRKIAVIGDLYSVTLDMTEATSILATSDNGTIIAGNVYENNFTYPAVIKTDSSGKQTWRWTSPTDKYFSMTSLSQVGNSNFIVTGSGTNNGAPVLKFNTLVVMLNDLGTLLWSIKLEDSVASIVNEGAITAPENAIILLINKGNIYDSTKMNRHLLKISSSGTILWDSTVRSDFKDYIYSKGKIFADNQDQFRVITIKRVSPMQAENSDTMRFSIYNYSGEVISDYLSPQKFMFFFDFSCAQDGNALLLQSNYGGSSIFRVAPNGTVLSGGIAISAYVNYIQPTFDNGIIACSSPSMGGGHLFWTRHDSKGDLVWSRMKKSNFNAMAEKTDGSFVAVWPTTEKAVLTKISPTGVSFEE